MQWTEFPKGHAAELGDAPAMMCPATALSLDKLSLVVQLVVECVYVFDFFIIVFLRKANSKSGNL